MLLTLRSLYESPPAGGTDYPDPVIVQSGSFRATTGQMTQLTAPVPFAGAAVAGNVLVYCLAGDKNTGTLTVTDNIGTGGGTNPWSVEQAVTGASTSVYIAWKIALGGETTITGTVGTAPTSGNNAFAFEASQSGAAAWGVSAEANTPYSDTNVAARSTGTTGAATYKGLAVAAVSVDTYTNATAGTWSNSFASAYAPGANVGDGGGAPLYVGTKVIDRTGTAESTWTRTAGAADDQMSGAIVVFGRQGLIPANTTPSFADTATGDLTFTVDRNHYVITDAVGVDDEVYRTEALSFGDIAVGDLSFTSQFSTTLDESISVTDAAAQVSSAPITREITDGIGLADSAATSQGYAFAQLDVIGLTDPRAQAGGHVQTQTDGIGLADPRTQGSALVRPVTDAIGGSDALSGMQGHGRAQTDPIGVTDAQAGTQAAARAVTDALGLTDPATQAQAYAATVTDPVGVLDDEAAGQGYAAVLTDPIGLVDTAAGSATVLRGLDDSIGLSDGATAAGSGGTTVEITDTIGIVDNGASRRIHPERTFDEPLGLTDSTSQAQGFARTVTDAIGAVDSIGTGLGRTLTDAIGAVDSVVSTQAHARSTVDGIGLTDGAFTGTGLTATITDALGLTDTADTAESYARAVTDPVGVLDPTAQAVAADRTQTDGIGLADSTSAGGTGALSVEITDPIGLADDEATASAIARPITDVVGTTDAAARATSSARSITDLIGATDPRAQAAGSSRSATDAIGLGDTAAQESTGEITREITDGIGVRDPFAAGQAHTRDVTDALGILDPRAQVFGLGRSITDSLGVNDSFTTLRATRITITDSLGLIDEIEPGGSAIIVIVEPIGVPAIETADRVSRGTSGVGVLDRVNRGTLVEVGTVPQAQAGTSVDRTERAR